MGSIFPDPPGTPASRGGCLRKWLTPNDVRALQLIGGLVLFGLAVHLIATAVQDDSVDGFSKVWIRVVVAGLVMPLVSVRLILWGTELVRNPNFRTATGIAILCVLCAVMGYILWFTGPPIHVAHNITTNPYLKNYTISYAWWRIVLGLIHFVVTIVFYVWSVRTFSAFGRSIQSPASFRKSIWVTAWLAPLIAIGVWAALGWFDIPMLDWLLP